MHLHRLRVVAVAGLAALALAATACGSAGGGGSTSGSASSPSGSSPGSSSSTSGSTTGSGSGSSSGSSSASGSGAAGTTDASKATSVADFGGMDGLVAAAKKEGQLNVIALPPDWANYGQIIKDFSAKYGITVNSQNPNGSSADEIQAAKTNKGTDKAPDVFDLGSAVALASTDQFAPYKVAAWDDIPDANKESTGLWVNDYTGVMSVGYNATKYGTITSLNDLKKAKFKGTVALNGNPTQAGAAFSGVVMAALANGGSADNIAPGVDFFVALKKAGTFVPVDPTPATIASGQTGVVIDWSYNQLAAAASVKKQGAEWKMFVPDKAAVGAYYTQAINKDAPHPAAARLWEEYLYTAAAQNQWMAGGAQPILFDTMKKAGTLDKNAEKNLPKTSSPIVQLTDAQQKAASDYLNKNWSKVA
jgi:putative spermidine/putrescine transport system substrate-binding protein